MTEFVASNGFHVHLPEGDDAFGVNGMFMNESERQALREFFLAERDTELGRWRSKEHPEYVVYPKINGSIRVVEEFTGQSAVARRNDAFTLMYGGIAAEYFAAHPESKPWHDAKPGEVWVLKLNVIDAEYAYVRTDGLNVTTENGDGWKNLTPNVAPSHMGLTAPTITAGRRIWPEVSNA